MFPAPRFVSVALLVTCAAADPARAGELSVLSVEPTPNALAVPVDAPIIVRFDRPVLRASVTPASFWAFARWSGTVAGDFAFGDRDTMVILTPARPFSAGETVTVILSHDLVAADGSPMRPAGYSFQFWTASRPAPLICRTIQVLNTRDDSGRGTRSYGGLATDLDGDGWLDITVVNEDTADLRVFLNRADGSGTFHDFLEPPFPVNDRASPSEPADFDRDGVADVCVANINTDTVSILLGNGDGTLGPQQEVRVGDTPRGIAVLDADGDGDFDIVNTNAGSSNLSVLFNNGSGFFGPPAFFDGGGNGEWALAAADMDEDGILDLVVGALTGRQMIVCRGNGDGSFSRVSTQASGGAVWMVAVGDLNADGHVDVSAANSSSNNGAVLLGDGAGNLGAPRTYATDAFPLATDLGDLDGDGDLDWMPACFNGDWQLWTNDGAGAFRLNQEFDAPRAASCATLFDIDNDADLDMALIDELADVVHVVRNHNVGDLDCDGRVNALDIQAFIVALFDPQDYPARYPDCDIRLADANGDGAVNALDIEQFIALLFGG